MTAATVTTLMLDTTNPSTPWFAWVHPDGPTIGYVYSRPEALSKAKDMGYACTHYIDMANGNQIRL